MSKDFEITRLLELAEHQKYATTVAAFEVIDHLESVDVPRKYMNRKPAVKAMIALTDNLVKYDYIDEEVRSKLEEELKAVVRTPTALDAVFAAPAGAAPVADESDEDLEEIGETVPVEELEDEDEDGVSSSADEDDEEEEEEDEEEDSDDDDDDDDDEEAVEEEEA